MRSRYIFWLLWVIVPCWAAASPATAAELHKIAPPDAFFFVWVRDMSALRDAWEKSPLGRCWNDAAVKRFTLPVRGRLTDLWQTTKKRFRMEREEVFSFLPGEVVFYSEAIVDHGEYFEMPICFAARTGLARERYTEWINRSIETLPPDAKKRQYEVEGVKVRAVEYRQELGGTPEEEEAEGGEPGAPRPAPVSVPAFFQYAFVDDVLLWTDSNDAVMRGMIKRLKSAPQRSAVDSPACARARDLLASESHAVGYAAPGQYVKYIARQMEKQAAAGAPFRQFSALGLEGLLGVAGAVHLGETQMRIATALNVPETGSGLVSILRRIKPSPLASLALTPASAIRYSSSAVDWAGIYSDLRKTIREAVPPMDMVFSMTVAQFENSTKVKLEELLALLGEEFSTFEVVPPDATGEAEATFLLAVKDSRRLGEAIDAVLASLEGQVHVEKTEFLGYTIRTARPQLPPGAAAGEDLAMSLALTDDFLAFSESSELVKQVLQLKAGKRTDHLAGSERYRQARALVPKALAGFKFIDMGSASFGKAFLGDLTAIGEAAEFMGPFGRLFDLESPVPAATMQRYFGLAASASFIEPFGLSGIMVLAAPKP